uniref:Nacht and ankyrin domain protein n=1 Tax=Colletotrichum fructicola (strain Nara gc5) TaxID=1213859 RepID=L2FQ15_COLFN
MSAEQYTVGWICAIKPEFVAAQEFLDEEHDAEGISAAVHDNNSYAFGRIGQHNVVIAVLPDGEYGTSSAATVVRDMVHSFPNIRIGLMVGIGGGAPTSKDDVRLGDIVVSAPRGGNSGVFEYDFGKTIQEQAFQHTRHLDQPPNVVRTAVTNLQAQYERKGHNIQEAVTDITGKNKRLRKYRRPDHSTDVLYQSNYLHTSGTGDCTAGCGTDSDNIVLRAERDEDEGDDDPAVHYGLIASANQLMKDATVRDRLAAEKGVLCFEMEAAGLMNHFPCLVVRGICDYSDTHKNDNWHGYAAMTAAAYAKDLLGKILPSKVEAEKKLADAVESVKQEMHDFQETIFSNREDDEVMSWLRAPDQSSNHKLAMQSHHEGTGSWLLEDPIYRDWKATRSAFLWVSGIPGCGKTVLSSTLIEDVRSTYSSACLAYFYFDFNDSSKQTLDSLLRSLIQQCSQKNEASKACIHDLWKSRPARRDEQPTTQQLYDCLVKILNQSDETWVIIDALDECTTRDGSYVDGILSFIKQLKQDTIGSTHILVTSRSVEDIERSFTEWAQKECFISLQHSLIQDDIQAYIRHELRPGGRFDRWQGTPRLQQIESTLMAKVDGMDLDETYHRMIRDIPEENKSNATTVLRFLAFSNRPFTVEELADALAVNLSESPKFDPAFRMPRPTEICLYCPSMLLLARTRKRARDQLDGYKEVLEVRLAHFSVKEYLTSDRLHAELRPLIEPSISRASLADICVAYLSEIKDAMTKHQIEEAFPFASYSAQSWLDHAAASRSLGHGAENGGLILDFLSSDNVAYENWFVMFDPEASFKITKPASGLYYACLYGLVSEVKSLLSQHVAVNEQGGRQGYPIVVASDKGHIKIVDLLIANGADVNLKDPFDLTALHVAASGGYVEIVQLLLDANAEVNAMTAEYETSLGWACSNGHLKVVRLLLDWGAVMKPPGGMSVNVLQLACSYGHVEIVRLLLNKGADVNGLGEHSESPLESAAAYGDVRIVSLLLQHGASLTLLPNQIGDALESAAAYGDERIMRILLDAGISVGRSTERDDCASLADEEQDGHAMLALWVAAKNRHVGAVRMLLDAGVGPNNAWAKNNGILQRFYNPHGQQEVEIIKLLLDHGFDVNDPESADESALEGAVRAGRDDIVRLLIDRGANVNSHEARPGNTGSGPLFSACRHGEESLARLLLDTGADANSVRSNDTALQVAVYEGHRNIARLLLERGADTGRVAKRHYPIGHRFDDPLLRAYKMRDWESVQMLLDYGASLDTVAGESCKNHSFLEIVCLDNDMHAVKMLLHRGVDVSLGLPVACYQGYVALVEVMLDGGSDISIHNTRYGDPLGAASYGGHVEVVRLLIERGAPVDASSPIYGSALIAASSRGHEKVINALLDEGANLNSNIGSHEDPKESGMPQNFAKLWSPADENGNIPASYGNALQAACHEGHEDTAWLLINRGADVNGPGGCYGSALAATSYCGKASIVQLLLESGASANSPGGIHGNALLSACRRGREDIVRILINNGANEDLDESLSTAIRGGHTHAVQTILEICQNRVSLDSNNLKDAIKTYDDCLIGMILDTMGTLTEETGIGPLQAAAATGKRDLVQTLQDRGASLTAEKLDFNEALVNASAKGDIDVVNFLLELGANPNQQYVITSEGQRWMYSSALHAASQAGHLEITQLLLQSGADATSPGGKYQYLTRAVIVSYDMDRFEMRNKYGQDLEQDVVERFEAIVKMLFVHGVDARWVRQDYNECLHQSTCVGFGTIVKILIEKGADINFYFEKSNTDVLEAALWCGYLHIAWILVDQGCHIPDSHWERYYGAQRKTLLHFAAEYGRKDIVQGHVSKKLDVNIRDDRGQTPLHLAVINGYHEITRTLLENGAEPSTRHKDLSGQTPLTYARGIDLGDGRGPIGPHTLPILFYFETYYYYA